MLQILHLKGLIYSRNYKPQYTNTKNIHTLGHFNKIVVKTHNDIFNDFFLITDVWADTSLIFDIFV